MTSYGTVDDIPFLTALEDKHDVVTPTFQEYVEEQINMTRHLSMIPLDTVPSIGNQTG